MRLYDYIRAKELYAFHNDGRSPHPRDIQKVFAERMMKQIMQIEQESPSIVEMYELYVQYKM